MAKDPTDKAPGKDVREARLTAALRDNLRRRKAAGEPPAAKDDPKKPS